MLLQLSARELPEIKMVRHANATKLRLRVEPTGIRLTVPLFCSQRQIQQFLNHSEQWLIETWNKQQAQFQQQIEFPEQINLFYHSQGFQIIRQKQHRTFQFDWEQHVILIRDQASEKALQAAILAYAKQYLPEYLQQVSQQIHLPYQLCSIRKPKTRWGSCSSKHDIMLNAGLALMPETLVRAVCVHELAHTRYFDHSAAFWNEVARYDVDYLENRRQLKKIQLPAWWLLS
jgi:predicted metal-dependent hydrolase